MSKTKIKQPKLQISIHRSDSIQTINMEKQRGVYHPVAAPAGRQNEAGINEPKSKIKLRQKEPSKKKVKKAQLQAACLTLCAFPDCMENSAAAAILLLLVLLSQVSHILVGILPAMPAVFLNADYYGIMSVLDALLHAIQGPDTWQEDDWKLRRPWIVRPRLALGETKPSVSLLDYIGGQHTEIREGEIYVFDKKKIKFCFPFVNSAFVLMPDLPVTAAKSLIELSPLAVPIVFGNSRKKANDRSVLDLTAEPFDAYDADRVKKLAEYAPTCYLEMVLFLKWFCGKKKHIERWKARIDSFRPVTHRGRFTVPTSDLKTDLLCAALALFRQFLHFASEKEEWITPEEANGFLLQYWRLVLPESAPCEGSNQADQTSLAYDAPEIFYQFLAEEYLSTYRNQIMQGGKG